LLITEIKPRSSADKKGLREGDLIVSINGYPLRDTLDFYLNISVVPLEIGIERDGRQFTVQFNSYREVLRLGIDVEEMKIKHCGNRCVFCFVDQNPKGLRRTLYVKDEDYRYSFLYGSFCTLSNITSRELSRIVEQHLSPLYISIHATDPEIRKRLLGLKKDDMLLEKIRYLTSNGIEIHTQIVMCPGINDGSVLLETVETLFSFYPHVRSVAVVPLGKTMHRDKLAPLRSVHSEDAGALIDLVSRLQKKYLAQCPSRFVFAADEFYLLRGAALPSNAAYEGYVQYENGVGCVRHFLTAFKKAAANFPQRIPGPLTILMVTGKSFFPVVKKQVLPVLNKIENLDAHVICAENRLLGPEITVAGLLCGRDMISAVQNSGKEADVIMLPETSFNAQGVTLDDMTLRDIKKALKTRIVTSDSLLDEENFICRQRT